MLTNHYLTHQPSCKRSLLPGWHECMHLTLCAGYFCIFCNKLCYWHIVKCVHVSVTKLGLHWNTPQICQNRISLWIKLWLCTHSQIMFKCCNASWIRHTRVCVTHPRFCLISNTTRDWNIPSCISRLCGNKTNCLLITSTHKCIDTHDNTLFRTQKYSNMTYERQHTRRRKKQNNPKHEHYDMHK